MGACCQTTKIPEIGDNCTANLNDNFNSKQQIFIIDQGSANTRCGFNIVDFQVTECPTIEIPTIFGRPAGLSQKIATFGQEVNDQLEDLEIEFLMENERFTNLDQMGQFFSHLIRKGRAQKHSVLLAEQMDQLDSQKDSIIQNLFESYNIPSLCFVPTSTLSLIGSGMTSGLVVESGERRSWAVPVIEAIPERNNVVFNEFAGRAVTLKLAELLNISGVVGSNRNRIFQLQSVKEQYCEVLSEERMPVLTTVTHILPDLSNIEIKQERFQAAEVLFGEQGIEKIVVESLEKSSNNIFSERMVLSGGTTMMKGYTLRLEQELRKLLPTEDLRVMENNDRQNLVWKGGKILTSESSQIMCDKWVTKKEYEEGGLSVFKKRSF